MIITLKIISNQSDTLTVSKLHFYYSYDAKKY